jgi:SAM-dependent methyltransferase
VSRAPGPDPFEDTFIAMAGARAVITATRLGVFDTLADEAAAAPAVADRLGLERTGVEALLTALAAEGYLEADAGGRHRPSASASRHLVSSSPESITSFIGGYNADAWDMLGGLEDLLAGRAEPPRHDHPVGDPHWETYIRGLFELSRDEHDANAAAVPAEDPRRLLDLAGGHGGFAIAMCRRHPRLRATVLDLPGSVRVGRRIVADEGLGDRVGFREGDVLEADLGAGVDVCSAFNLLHHLPDHAVQTLLRRVRASLAAGGLLVIGDTERTEPGEPPSRNGALSGLVYYASSGTRNYTRREVTGWLEDAGFSQLRVVRNQRSPWRVLYLARA